MVRKICAASQAITMPGGTTQTTGVRAITKDLQAAAAAAMTTQRAVLGHLLGEVLGIAIGIAIKIKNRDGSSHRDQNRDRDRPRRLDRRRRRGKVTSNKSKRSDASSMALDGLTFYRI